MDPRIREHAHLIANALDLSAGDDFVIKAEPMADDLVTALYEVAGERDANPLAVRTNRSHMDVQVYFPSAVAAMLPSQPEMSTGRT